MDWKRKASYSIKVLLLLSFCLALFIEVVYAQARLLGRIVDDKGKPVVAAIVSLTGNGRTGAVITNSNGYYTFLGLPEGEYNIKALKSGLSSPKKSISLKDNVTLMYNLQIGDMAMNNIEEEKPAVELPKVAVVTKKKKKIVKKTIKKAPAKEPQKKKEPVIEEPLPEETPKLAPVETTQDTLIVASAEEQLKTKVDSIHLNQESVVEQIEEDAIQKTLQEAIKTEDSKQLVFEKGVSIKGGLEKIYDYLEYPISAKYVSRNVYVIARVYVNKEGMLRRIDIIKQGPQVFNEEVYRVLTENISFEPAEYNSEKVAGTMTVVVNFTPKN